MCGGAGGGHDDGGGGGHDDGGGGGHDGDDILNNILDVFMRSYTFSGAMDLLIENCFFQAILDAKKIELPMLVTKFSAQYLHPAWYVCSLLTIFARLY